MILLPVPIELATTVTFCPAQIAQQCTPVCPQHGSPSSTLEWPDQLHVNTSSSLHLRSDRNDE
jgi:hypothetical protein